MAQRLQGAGNRLRMIQEAMKGHVEAADFIGKYTENQEHR